ncbi:HsdM family class I SAM-dependent methyltransferase [Haloferula sargassicola]|uniref:site-specific DNA-methyltransferase (adenine-specific) n=1 Tax=Haloferula sargassicola TaxID=490096 RepID=A0ABP9UPX5_9BACT
MLLSELSNSLGYDDSPLYREDNAEGLLAPEDQHWLRAARSAGVLGTYFFKTTPDAKESKATVRPAVHLARADTPKEAREIHRKLWNQGLNPFLIVLLPGQVRVYSGFAFDPESEETGAVTKPIPTEEGAARVVEALSAFTADAINRGEIWDRNAAFLGSEQRVDTTLLKNLRSLAETLHTRFDLPRATCHSLIGKFVYLAYLRARDILSDPWLRDAAGVEPAALFRGEAFAPSVTLGAFRKLVTALEKRFNGQIFPIPWGSRRAPRSRAVQLVAQVFAGEETTGQTHLGFRAYDFSAIPVEFLSSIYEQFLHSNDGEPDNDESPSTAASDPEKRGAHYTPEPLAEYLVSELHSVRPLRPGMTVLDPCCGSGVFLVVAFRRLVEMRCREQNRENLNPRELRELLVSSIYAVERNKIACQIAGFSLILTMLGYVDPPELHRNKAFKFPTLVGKNLFAEDFFNENGRFWRDIVSQDGLALRFDAILGNPPWVELIENHKKANHYAQWVKDHPEFLVPRKRTGEAFAWRVMDCLAENGTVGLILHAKTLTNDQVETWRTRFFSEVRVRRVTNFANLAYVLFPSAKTACATLIYAKRKSSELSGNILHFGPFLANQRSTVPRRGSKRRSWSVGFSDTEIKIIPETCAASGKALVWKQALWAGVRDEVALRKLHSIFSTTLGKISDEQGWKLALGLQLRSDCGTKKNPYEEVFDDSGANVLHGLKLLDHKAFVYGKGSLVIDPRFLIENTVGAFIRKRGGTKGLTLTKGPRLFLWNNFAAYSDKPFIILHDKIGLSGASPKAAKAVAAIWSSSYVSYLLFFVTSAAWGIDRSQIDKGDAEKLPFPEWTTEREKKLYEAWEAAAALEQRGADFGEVKALLDRKVEEALGLPPSVSFVVREFFRTRYQLVQGKNPSFLRVQPEESELTSYADRLRGELDGFLSGKAHHRILVLHSRHGNCVSVTLTRNGGPFSTEVREAKGTEAKTLRSLLDAAEEKYCQWAYVKRSVVLRDGDTLHLIKPPRRLEWTETQAMVDADDIIAEGIESNRNGA